jgi:hypothetical protein
VNHPGTHLFLGRFAPTVSGAMTITVPKQALNLAGVATAQGGRRWSGDGSVSPAAAWLTSRRQKPRVFARVLSTTAISACRRLPSTYEIDSRRHRGVEQPQCGVGQWSSESVLRP